jgi:lipopolysaccharide export system ATP-binding protein
MGIGYLPQEPSVFTGLTVYENLKVIGDRIYRASSGEKVEEMLRIIGLEKVRDSPAGSLSGGEKRRLEVARTLLLEPKYILFDEPFSQIDPKTVYELIEIILKMRERGIGVLITDHSAREVFKVCDRIYIITDGEVVIEGSPEDLKQNPTVKEIYLGRLFEI